MYKFFLIYLLTFVQFPLILLVVFDLIDYFTLFLVMFILGGYVFAGQLKLKDVNSDWSPRASNGIMLFFALTYFISNISMILDIVENIKNGTYFDFAYMLAVDRYAGEAEEGAFKKISTILFFSYCTSLGSSFTHLSKKHWLCLLIMIFIESSSLARAGVLLGISIIAIEVIMVKRNYFKSAKLSTWVKLLLKIPIYIVPIFLFSAYFRLTPADDMVPILFDKFLSYSVAMYLAFSDWLTQANLFGITMGYNTFSIFYKLLGFEFPQGHYTVLVNTPLGETNIYTILRGLIEDFTIIGAFLFFFISGVAFKKFDSNPNIFNYLIARFFGLIVLYFIYSPYIFATLFVGYHLPLIFKFIQFSFVREPLKNSQDYRT